MLLVIGLLTLAFYLLLTRTTCAADPGCLPRAMLALAGLSGAAVLALVWNFARDITRPLRDVTEVAERIAAGDSSGRVLTQRQDELGDLIRAFGQMSEYQRAQIARLAQTSRRFATVIEHMADGVLIIDNLGTVLMINPAACRLLATNEREAVGRSFAAVVRHHALIELWQRGRESRSEEIEAVEVSPQMFLQAVLTPYRSDATSGFVVLLQDLTQVRRLQVIRRDFISNLSHELRTPLAALRAVVETLQGGALDDPPAAERFLQRAESEIDTMTQMVGELTELSQIESGQIRLRLAPVSAEELAERPLDRMQPMAEAGGVELAADLAPDLPRVLVDAERIGQVITNLLHNAVKYTPRGGRVLLTTAGKLRPGEEPLMAVPAALGDEQAAAPEQPAARMLVFEVRDTGVGISQVDLPRIFERFYKSDRARTRGRGGTGLGLAIARHIVETHGGRVWATSKEGKGSSFFFSVPVVEESKGAGEQGSGGEEEIGD